MFESKKINKNLCAIAMASVFAMGINVAEGSKEERDLGKLTKAPLSTSPMPSKKLSESEAQKACEIVDVCRGLILPTIQGKTFRGKNISATRRFDEKIEKVGLAKKTDQSFEFKYRCNGETRGRITTLKDERALILKCCVFLSDASFETGKKPTCVDEIILMALAFNNPDVLRVVLEMGADVNKRHLSSEMREGKSVKIPLLPIAGAICEYEEESVRLLLEFGANPNAVCYYNSVPLTLAANAKAFKIASILLEYGATPNKWSMNDTPLSAAVNANDTEMVKLLLKAGAKTNVKGIIKFPIFDAVQHDNPEMLDLLVKRGADIEILGPGGVTPLSCAILFKRKKSMDYLLAHGANIFGCFCHQGEGFPPAVRARFQEIYQAFFASPDEDDPDKMAQRAYAVGNLRRIHPMDRENGVLDLIMHRANIGWIPCDLITDKVIKYWITVSGCEMPVHFFDDVPLSGCGMVMHLFDDVPLKAIIDLRSSMFEKKSEMPEGFPDVNREISKLPEEHRKKVEDFFERARQEIEEEEMHNEPKDALPVSVEAESGEIEYVTYLRPEPKGPRAPRVKEEESRITPVVEETDAESEKSAKPFFRQPYARIFQSCDRSTKIEGKTFDMLIKGIQELCAFLTKAGFECALILRNNHYVLALGTFPEWAEALRRYNMPNRLSLDHGDNDTYSIFFDSTFSYLVHALCLLAQSEGPLSEKALDKLKKYAEEERLLYPILEIYTELEPYFKPYFF